MDVDIPCDHDGSRMKERIKDAFPLSSLGCRAGDGEKGGQYD